LSKHTHTNIHENSSQFAKFVLTLTHKHSRNFVFFAKFIYFSRKFFSICLHTHNHSRNFVFFRENYYFFAKILLNSLNFYKYTHTNIRENSSQFAKFVLTLTHTNIRENSSQFAKFVLTLTHKHSRNFVFIAKLIYFSRKFFSIRLPTQSQTFAKCRLFREIDLFLAKILLNSRNLSKHTHTNIRENSCQFAKFVLTLTHKHSRNFVFFAKFIYFSRKFFSIRLHTHNHSRNFVFFAKIIIFS